MRFGDFFLMAFVPPFEVLFPLSDDMRGVVSALNEICNRSRVVEIPLGYLSARGADLDEVDAQAEGTH